MASEMRPFVNGQTGTVTNLAPHQGTMSSKTLEVCFTRDVVILPNSKPTPTSLLMCMKVGDILHYNAKVRIHPCLQHPVYTAVKVWFPNTKSNVGEDSPSSQEPVPPTKSTAEMLRKSIVKLLKDKGSLTVEQLHSELRPCSAEMHQLYGNTTEVLRTFLAFHKTHFLLVDGRVGLLKGGKPLVRKCIQAVKKLLRPLGSAPVYRLFELLQGCDKDVRNFIFSSKALFSFLETHSDDFVILPGGTVFAIERSDDESDADVPQRAKTATEDPKLANILRCLTSLLNKKERVPLYKLYDELNQSSPDTLQVVGTKPSDLVKLLARWPGAFVVHANQMVQLMKPAELENRNGASQKDGKQKKLTNSLEQNPLPRHHSGQVQSIGAQFGFIRHGFAASDNIFFDAVAYMEPAKDLKSVLAPGDLVDCLFFNTQADKRNKYRAVAVWKAIRDDVDPGGALAELLALPTVITSPVYYGEAEVAYFARDFGYCHPHGDSDADSLIEFEEGGKTQPALITFHLGCMQGQQQLNELRAQLKRGARMMFLARQCPAARDSVFPVHWSVISLWPPTKSTDNVNPSDVQSVTAEVQELTTEGGRLSFGNDPWAHSITFYWKQIMSRADGLLDKAGYARVGDTFFCIVTSGQMMKESSRWVAIEMFPCNLDMVSSAPGKYLSCPAMDLPQRVSFGMGNPVAKPSDHGVAWSKSSSSESHPVRKPEPRESSNSLLQPIVMGDVDLLLDLGSKSADGNAQVAARDAAKLETTIPKIVDGTGKIVSMDKYEGILETDDGDVLKFTAHAFFYNGRPVSHLSFPIGTQVHFDDKYTEMGEMYADTIWIGKKPLPGRSKRLPPVAERGI